MYLNNYLQRCLLFIPSPLLSTISMLPTAVDVLASVLLVGFCLAYIYALARVLCRPCAIG